MLTVTQETIRNLRSMVREKLELEGMIRRFNYDLDTAPMSDMPRSGNTSDPTAKKAEKITALQEQWRAKAGQIAEVIAEVEKLLPVLDAKRRRIFRLYYFDCLSDVRIAHITNYATDVVGRYRRQGVESILEEAKRRG